MKDQSIVCFTKALLVLAGISVCSVALAQEIAHPYHPGDVLHVLVKFSGPDARKISSAAVNLEFVGDANAIRKDQPNFASTLYLSESHSTPEPNTFDVSIKVPINQASGEYRVGYLRGIITEPSVVIEYRAPADFKERTYTIDNPERIVRPTVEIK